METAYISVFFLKDPLVKVSTVCPSAFSAGSAKVAPNPNNQANIPAINMPRAYVYKGDPATAGIALNAAGTILPDCSPNLARP